MDCGGFICCSFVVFLFVVSTTVLAGRFYLGPRRTVYGEDLIVFTRQLGHMLKMKLPLNECIFHLFNEYKQSMRIAHIFMVSALKATMSHLEEGLSLSQSFARQTGIFPQFYVWLVNVGETSERLPEVLETTAKFMEQNTRAKQKLWELLIYPAMIMIFMLLIFLFLTLYILPTFVSLFEGMNLTLPLVTKIVITISKTLRDPFIVLPGFMIFFLIIFIFVILRFNVFELLVLYFPGFSRLTRFREYSTFASILGILLKGGVPESDAMILATSTIKNSFLRRRMEKNLKEQYSSLSQMLKQNKLFNRSFIWIITMGEKTETLDDVLIEVGKLYSEEARLLTEKFNGWLAPSFILAAGLCVGTVIISVFLPIIQLISGLAKYSMP